MRAMVSNRWWPVVISVVLVAAIAAGCSSGDDDASGDTEPAAESSNNAAGDGSLGWCEDVTVEEFQQLFGERFTVVKRGGVQHDCNVVAKDTYIGEALAITNFTQVGYGPSFDEARAAADGDFLCPDGTRDIDGLGDRAFFVPTCDPEERPAEALHIEANGEHLRLLAFDIPIEEIATVEENLIALAERLLD
jgi:hypothetical protein